MEKSGGVRPGGGATYPGIPPMEVLGVVSPPEEEEVSPYPGVYNLAPRRGGSQLRGSHTLTARSRITTVAMKPYSGSHL